MKLYEIGFNACFAGTCRKEYLTLNLSKLWLNHWKRIPEHIYPHRESKISPRARKILSLIEEESLTQCTVEGIARRLNISGSHFRFEFKTQFGINFRKFKQRLFTHYESVLLMSHNLKLNDIYQILNYSHFTNYSRSFKRRHGITWRKLHDKEEMITPLS